MGITGIATPQCLTLSLRNTVNSCQRSRVSFIYRSAFRLPLRLPSGVFWERSIRLKPPSQRSTTERNVHLSTRALLEVPSTSVTRAIEFIAKNKGVVLRDWAKRPTRSYDCRAVFPPSVRKPLYNGVSSGFVHKVIEEFHQSVLQHSLGSHFVQIKLEGGSRTVLTMLESDLEARKRSDLVEVDLDKREYPSYSAALKLARPTTFLGVPQVLVQLVPGSVDS